MELKGRVAVVTGAARGIGLAVARALGRAGACVTLVDVDGAAWQIDEFRHRDLVLAEIELDSEDEAVTFPSWLAPFVEREVTLEPEYVNINLAK